MKDFCDVTDRLAKRFDFFAEQIKSLPSAPTNQEEGQKYVPPLKRLLLPTPPPDQMMPVQTVTSEAPQPPQDNKGIQKGEQQ